MNQNTIAELIVKIEAEAKEAEQNLEEAQKLEEEGDYSDAMISMDRTYAEGFSDALDLVLRILKGEDKE
jgi:Tfp pilus assembly protein PilF